MSDRLKELLEQEEREGKVQDFEQRYQADPEAISDEEAARRYRELMARLEEKDVDEDLEQAHEEAFGNLPDKERRTLAERFRDATKDASRPYAGYKQEQDLDEASSPRELGRMTRQAAREDPDLLEQVVGEDSPLTGTAGRVALAGLAVFAAKRFLGRR